MRYARVLGIVLILLGIFAAAVPDEALARAGGSRSFGSRGSRTFSSPSRTYSTPAPSTAPSARPLGSSSPAPLGQPSPLGGLWRGMAGGLLGGMLGGLLFSGLGHAGGLGAGGGMGFGLLDMLLLGGIAYGIFWMIRRNRAQAAPAGAYHGTGMREDRVSPGGGVATLEPQLGGAEDRSRGIGHIRQMDPAFSEGAFADWCTDAFFRIQAAWMRRDVEGLRPLLTDEMAASFRQEIEASRAKGQINRLENVTVRSVEIAEAWQEQGQDFVTVRFLANLLDYTVDEGSGAVVAGSASEPVKFEEFWTWVRPVGPNAWRLSAIHQA